MSAKATAAAVNYRLAIEADELSSEQIAAAERKIAMTKEVKPVGRDASRHKFEKMPGNVKGTPCNKCLQHKNHLNHYTDDTRTKKATDRAQMHRALDRMLAKK